MTCPPTPPAPTTVTRVFRNRFCPSSPKNRIFRSNLVLTAVPFIPALDGQTSWEDHFVAHLDDRHLGGVVALGMPNQRIETCGGNDDRPVRTTSQPPTHMRYELGEATAVAGRELRVVGERMRMELDY